MKIAKKIADIIEEDDMWQALYKLSEPHVGYQFVIVSAIDRPRLKQLETCIFGVKDPAPLIQAVEGEDYIVALAAFKSIIDWLDLEGSVKEVFDHETALKAAGYEILTDEMIN